MWEARLPDGYCMGPQDNNGCLVMPGTFKFLVTQEPLNIMALPHSSKV